MPVRQYANAPATTLANSCTALATSIEVTATTGMPITYPFTLIIDRGTATEEAVSVTGAASTTLTVTRGIDDTTAFAHVQGAEVAHGITAQDIREANTHVNADSGVHGVVGDVVGTTDTQLLTNKTATTEDTADDSDALATTAFVKAALLAAHPVGDIVVNISGTDPGTYLGGTWTAWGSGRVPVGVDAGQSEFNTVEETGGEKTHLLTAAESGVPNHSHVGEAGYAYDAAGGYGSVPEAVYGQGFGLMAGGGQGYANRPMVWNLTEGNQHNHSVTVYQNAPANAASAHNNLQPYITCYMFKRTA